MKKFLLSLFTLLVALPHSGAQPIQNGCEQIQKTQVILVGDSWAYFSWLYKGFRESLRKYGHADKVENGMRSTATGATAETFLDPRVKFNVLQSLRLHSEATAVVMFLGGNDVMSAWRSWHEDYSSLDQRANEVAVRLSAVIEYIREERPDINIIVSSYDYPNFVEPLINWPENPYHDFWRRLGYPTMEQANNALLHGETNRVAWCDSMEVYFLNNIGLMQYVFGQETPLPVWPYDPYPPRSVPFPGGDPRYPSPQKAMGLWGIDVYHLGPEGYFEIANNAMREYLMPWFRGNVSTTYRSDGRYDGWVTDRGQTGVGELRMGRTQEGRPVKGILTFYTADIPEDAEITHASLFVTRKRVVGGNTPLEEKIFPTNARIDIKSGVFGSDVLPEAIDFNDEADLEDVGCFVGSAYKNDFAFRVDLRPEAMAFINKSGVTQFRITIDPKNLSVNEMGVFYGGDEPEPYYAPYLDVYYKVNGEYVVTSTQLHQSAPAISLYPNPATQYVTVKGISSDQVADVKVFNALGALMSHAGAMQNADSYRIDMPDWQAGVYFIQIPGLQQKLTFVKQ